VFKRLFRCYYDEVTLSASALESLGIEESEPDVCEDTHENRRLLRANGFMWDTVDGDDGLPTGLIRAFHKDSLTARRDSVWDSRKPIMVDPSDRYSEYVGPEEYPLDFDMPFWLKMRKQTWVDIQLGRKKATPSIAHFPVRCEQIRLDGTRCWNWAPRPDQVKRCKSHRGWKQDADLAKAQIARMRILQAAPAAADGLIELSETAAGEAVRLKAQTEILDRAGVRAGSEIDVTVRDETTDHAAIVRERLEKLAKAAVSRELEAKAAAEAESGDIVEAEVVTDDVDRAEG
jgi:hypothetical protein